MEYHGKRNEEYHVMTNMTYMNVQKLKKNNSGAEKKNQTENQSF